MQHHEKAETVPMAPRFEAPGVTLYAGDCRDVLAAMPSDSVDAVVCDPPYEIGFMGRSWDSSGVAFSPATWEAALRVAKPGAHLLAFGGSRTFHRIAVAIEDAGWEIRDTLSWLYGSGFPKSLDVAKQLDKLAGHWRGRAGEITSANGSMENPNRERTDKGEPVTPAAAAAGWGTALKPAWEPVVLARKPLAGTVAANWLEYGTGAINIDGCRISTNGEQINAPQSDPEARQGAVGQAHTFSRLDRDEFNRRQRDAVERANRMGRWPANVALDDTAAAMLDAQGGAAGASRFFYCAKAATSEKPWDARARRGPRQNPEGYSDIPSGEFGGNAEAVHPTVKPLDLMRWLVRLVTPPGGTVLDPFAGTGTTGEAAVIEGFSTVLVEQHDPYCDLIVQRLSKPIQPTLGGVA